MLRIQATIGLTTYYFASEPLDYDNRYWEPRISNPFAIARYFNSSDKSGNKIRSMDVTLDNRDGYFNLIEKNDGLLNAKFTLYFNEGDDVVKTFSGRVNKINNYGDDISLNLREVGYEYLKEKFPDAQIAYDYYSASGINDSWNAIPIHFGTVNRYPCPWVNLFYSHFMIGSGPIFKVRKVYFDKTIIYDEAAGINGYRATPESAEIKVRVFKGAKSGDPVEVVEGVTSDYPGFAYIQLYKIVDAVEVPADPVNPDGESVQVYVDIDGISNSGGTAAERNPMQLLYNLFTKPYTGHEGYGLAIPAIDIDFATAITASATNAFKLDGTIDNTTEFGEWVDEILRCCRGQLSENDGKITAKIDVAAAAPSIHFDETGEIGYNCIVGNWTEPDRDSQTNRIKLSYSWNFESSNFNKKPAINAESPLGDPNLVDESHALRIGKWNTETLEFKLIKDDTTAHKLAQYYLKNITKQLKTFSLTTETEIPDIDAGVVVKVTSPKFGWVEKQCRITQITRNEEYTEVELKEYSADIFTFIDPGTEAEDSGSQYSIYNIPAKPTLNTITVKNTILTDGNNQTTLNVSFVKPATNVQMIALYCKEESEAEDQFRLVDFTINESSMSTIWKGRASGNYNFRLVSISTVNIYSDISIDSGDKHYLGQPDAEDVLALTGDAVAPGTPVISDVNPVIGGASIYISISGGLPEDFSHFEIYRKIGSDEPVLIDEKHTSQLFTDVDRTTGYDTRIYYAVAVDSTGNTSDMSLASASVTPLKVNTNDIAAGSVTTDLLTAEQILSKDIRTTCNAGNGVVSGVLFNSSGIQAWNGSCKTFDINATTGNVSMSGTITALAGAIGGWCIDTGCLYSNNIGLFSNGSIQTLDFVSGNNGWKIDCFGNAEFNNANIRGEIRSSVFVKNEISVIGGSTLIRPAALAEIVSFASGECGALGKDFEEFNIGDVIRIKSGVNDFWGIVDHAFYDEYTFCNWIMIFTCKYGSQSWTPTSGQSIINYGSCIGAGGIFLDGQSGYMDIYTHDGCPWNGTCSRVRLGNLCGWGAFGTNYGIAIGNPTGNYMTYDTNSGYLNILGNINVKSVLPLSIPAGAVGEWSAKGSTTAGIALTGGVKDISGYGRNGTADGASIVSSDKGNVFSFDGINDTIQMVSTPFRGSTSFSVSMWIKTAGLAAGMTLNGYWSNQYIPSGVGNESGQMLFSVRNGVNGTVTVTDTTSHFDNKWHHFSFVADGATIKIYRDGIEVASAASVGLTWNVWGIPFYLGINPNGAQYYGKFLGFGFSQFNRALTAEEVKTLYLFGSQQESGVITADRVQTGVLQSLNWGTTLGSCISMNDGTFTLGGSSLPKLSWNGSVLTVRGVICATSGCFTGSLCSCVGTIGGWTLSAIAIGSTGICLYRDCTIYTNTGTCYAMHGRMYEGGSYINAYGFSTSSSTARASFLAGVTTAAYTAPSGTAMATAQPFFYVGSGSTAFLQYYNGIVTVKGQVCATSGVIGSFNVYCWSGSLYALCSSHYLNETNCTSFMLLTGCSGSVTSINQSLTLSQTIAGSTSSVQLITTFGNTADFAALKISIPSTSYYAMCTNARIQASAFCVVSDKHLKTDFQDISILPYLRDLPITKWRFKDSPDYQIGPMAQDWNCVFKFNRDWQTNLTVGNLDGVALKAVKEVDENVQVIDKCILKLETENSTLKDWISKLSEKISNIEMSMNVC